MEDAKERLKREAEKRREEFIEHALYIDLRC